jgi:hypothetical protein
VILLAAVFAFSCSTAPKELAVSPYALMDEDMDIFFLLPVAGHKEAARVFAQKLFPAVSEKDRNAILSRLDTVYCGWKGGKMQVLVSGNFPAVALKSALSQKNGWLKVSAQIPGADSSGEKVSFYRNSGAGVEVYTEIPGLVFVAEDALPMIERSRYAPSPDPGLPAWVTEGLPAGTSVKEAPSALRFFGRNFSSLAKKFFALNLPGDGAISGATVDGVLENEEGKNYLLSLAVDVKDKRAVLPAKLLLSLIGLFSGAEIASGEGTVISIRNIPVPSDMVTNLL